MTSPLCSGFWVGARRCLLVAAAALCAPAIRGAAGEEISRFLSSFENLPPSVYRPDTARPEVQAALSARHPGYLRFLAEHPGRWRVDWNESTGTPHRIYGDSFPLAGPAPLPSTGPGDLEASARRFLDRHADLAPASTDDLELELEKDLGPFRVIRFRQTRGGIPVLGARAELWVAPGGRAILIGLDVLPETLLASCAAPPSIGPEFAERRAETHAAGAGRGFARESTRMVIAPVYEGRRLSARLAWEVRALGAGALGKWTYLIAAHDSRDSGQLAGSVLGAWDESARGSVSGWASGKASPGLSPDTTWNPAENVLLPNLQVNGGQGSAVTDSAGAFEIEFPGNGSVTVSTSLSGPFCRVDNAAGSDLSFSKSFKAGDQVDIAFNATPSEFGTAQVNAFIGVNRAHDYYKELDPTFTAIDSPALAQVNIDDSCNAFFIPEGNGVLAFFRSNPCVNSAYSTVIYHEYSHLVVWKAFGSVSPMAAYNEGVADASSALITDQPFIGEAFSGRQGGPPIRDLSQTPLVYPDDVLHEPHTAGLILGGAIWDLRGELGGALGPEAGLALARRLLFRSFFLAPPLLSSDVALDFLSLDDDDAILANGTPHFAEIARAFGRHGLRPPGELSISHTRLTDSVLTGPFQVKAKVESDFDSVTPTEVTLHYSVDGGFLFVAKPMAPVGGEEFQASIPSQATGTTVLYYIEASGTGGARATFPPFAPQEETVAFAVGETSVVFTDNFDGAEKGWAHGLIPNGNPQNRDDWQRGMHRPGMPDLEDYVDGNLLDPLAAFSLPNCWGNDLGTSGDKNYSDSSRNFLQSPPIDCRGMKGVHLRFRRWLTIERADRARVLVNDVPVYQSSLDRDTLDVGWRLLDYDISSIADDKPDVIVRFDLFSNLEGNAGGWNIDDVSMVAVGVPSERPALASIEPAFAFKSGGGSFTLRGSGFTTAAATELHFGSSPAQGFDVVDSQTIRGTVPAAALAGTVVISLQNAGGAVALPGAFSYFDLPALDSLVPPRARLEGGDSLSVQGNYFTPGTIVEIDGKPLSSPTQVGNEVIFGGVPAGAGIGRVDVVIKSAFGESRFPSAFEYVEPPALTAVEPDRGPRAGGISFTLRGEFFPADASTVAIEFGSERVETFTVNSGTEITGLVPPAESDGLVDVMITTPGGFALLRGAFLYGAGPPVVFIRGDVNRDRAVEITDSIFVLNALFLGEGKIECEDAADVTDDGVVDISDPVALLGYLFVGGPPPASPHPTSGADETLDAIGCEFGV